MLMLILRFYEASSNQSIPCIAASLDYAQTKTHTNILFRFKVLEFFYILFWICLLVHFYIFFNFLFSSTSLCITSLVCIDLESICWAFLQYALSNVSSNGLPEKRQRCIGFICLTFLQCVFLNVSSNCLPKRMQSQTGFVNFVFLRCAFSSVSSNCLPLKMHNHTGCICWACLHYAFSDVPSKN